MYHHLEPMIHRFQMKGKYYVLDVNSGIIHVIDALTDAVLAIYNGSNKEEVLTALIGKEFPSEDGVEIVTKESLLELLGEIDELIGAEMLFAPMSEDFKLTASEEPIVKALCLNIAHDCNLACKYCFASQGDYGGVKRELMPFDVAKRAVDAEAPAPFRPLFNADSPEFISDKEAVDLTNFEFDIEGNKLRTRRGLGSPLLKPPRLSGPSSTGVTTECTGNCGIGVAPVVEEKKQLLIDYLGTRLIGSIPVNIELPWVSFKDYVEYFTLKPPRLSGPSSTNFFANTFATLLLPAPAGPSIAMDRRFILLPFFAR